MTKFHVGDVVVAKKNAPYTITKDGWCGVVVRTDDNGVILVKSLRGNEQQYTVNDQYFVLKDKSDRDGIRIFADGRRVVAEMLRGETVTAFAEAKCHEDDDFDFMTGAEIALGRLKEKILNRRRFKPGDLVLVKRDHLEHGFSEDSLVELREHVGGDKWMAVGYSKEINGLVLRYIGEGEFEEAKFFPG